MSSDSPPFLAFKQAVQRAGGQSAFAAICGCTQGNISQLLNRRRVLPSRYVLPVEAATGISRHELRPDIYPVEPLARPVEYNRRGDLNHQVAP